MNIGTMEMIVIFLVVIFVLGPERTILYARKLGKLLRILKVYMLSLTGELRETVIEPLQEIQEPLRDLSAPFEELAKATQKPVDEFNAAVNQLDNTQLGVSKADETKLEEPEMLEEAELEEDEIIAEVDTSLNVDPEPEAHVNADIEDAGDVKTNPDDMPAAVEIGSQETDFKT